MIYYNLRRFLILFFIVIFFFSPWFLHAVVNAVTGDSVWGIANRTGETDDIIASKIEAISPDISQSDALFTSKMDNIEAKINDVATPLSSNDISAGSITVSSAGSYRLTEDVTADITISGSQVFLDLNDRIVTGLLVISGDNIEVKNGTVLPSVLDSGSDTGGILVSGTAESVIVKDLTVKVSDQVADNSFPGRTGIQITGDYIQIMNCYVIAGSAATFTSGGSVAGMGGSGIKIESAASFILVQNCVFESGNGGANTGGGATDDGGDAGFGICVNQGSNVEIVDNLVFSTGAGGNSSNGNGGDGGDGVKVFSGSTDVSVRGTTIRNTGAAGTGGAGAVAGKAINDDVAQGASESIIYGNFAHNIANAVNFDLQASGIEKGVNTPNPPDTTVLNEFANVYV